MKQVIKNVLSKIGMRVLLLISGLLIILIVLMAIIFGKKEVVIEKDIQDYSNDWKIVETGEMVSFPIRMDAKDFGSISFEKKLPAEMKTDLYFCVSTYYQNIEVYVNGDLIYSRDNNSEYAFNRGFNLSIHTFSIDTDYENQNITMKVMKAGNSLFRINEVKVGQKSNIITFLFNKGFYNIVHCAIITFISFVLLTVYLLMLGKKQSINYINFAWSSCFSILSCIWMITDIKELQIFLSNKSLAYVLSYISFMGMPIPMILFIKRLCKNKVNIRMLTVLSYINIANIIINIIFDLTGIASFVQTSIIIKIIIFTSVILLMTIIFIEYFKYRNKDLKLIIIGTAFLFISAIIDIVIYYYNDSLTATNSEFFKYGLIIYNLFLGLTIYKLFWSDIKQETTAEIYKNLAYSDIMTSLGNRLKFNDDIIALNEKKDKENIIVIMYDIDNLKETNDKFGHEYGDKIIIKLAKFMTKYFDKNICYRIGGDEFITLLVNKKEDDIVSLLKKFIIDINKSNNENEKKLYVSFDYVVDTGDYSTYNSFDKMLHKVDEKMYIMKKENKERRLKNMELEKNMDINIFSKESFKLIGKEGSTEMKGNWIQKLWNQANDNFDQISNLAKLDENGNIVGMWGAMSDFERKFKSWENDFTEGLYLASVEVKDDAEAPEGWTSWQVPGFKYVCVKVDADYMEIFDYIINDYLYDHGYDLVGAVLEYYSPSENGQLYLLFPIEKL